MYYTCSYTCKIYKIPTVPPGGGGGGVVALSSQPVPLPRLPMPTAPHTPLPKSRGSLLLILSTPDHFPRQQCTSPHPIVFSPAPHHHLLLRIYSPGPLTLFFATLPREIPYLR